AHGRQQHRGRAARGRGAGWHPLERVPCECAGYGRRAEGFHHHPQIQGRYFNSIARTITLAQTNAAFRELWTGSAPLIHVSDKQDITSAQLAAAFDASRKVAVAAPKEGATKTFAYESFGKPGTIASDTQIADLGVRTIRFANNVRLNLKKTDFEAGKVRFVVRLGDGILDLPKDQPGLAQMLSMTSTAGALKKQSLEDLKDIFAGKVITLGSAVKDDAFIAVG